MFDDEENENKIELQKYFSSRLNYIELLK